jgi:excisionase family DNA binding protein
MLKTRSGDVVGAGTGPVPAGVRTDAETFLTRAEAAEYLRVSKPTLERWARAGIGPAFTTFGHRKVLYRLSDLRAYAGVEVA